MSAVEDEEQRQLAEAIALSMGEGSSNSAQAGPSTQTRKRRVITLDESDEDDIVPVSKSESRSVAQKRDSSQTASSSSGPTSTNGLPSRAEMEKERLARVKAREAAGQTTSTPSVRARDTSRPSGAHTFGSQGALTSAHAAASTSQASLPQPKYLEPVTLHVFNKYRPNVGQSIKFEEIVQNKHALRKAIICTMCVDPTWLLSQFGAAPLVLVAKGGSGDTPGSYSGKPWPTCELVIPKMGKIDGSGHQTFHPKFLILFHQTFTRIVISTANLMDFDYDTLDNMVWIVDIPNDSSTPDASNDSAFYKGFDDLLSGIGVASEHWRAALQRLDYSRVDASYRLVVSLAGQYADGSAEHRQRKYGFPALGRALEELEFTSSPRASLQLECQTSSVGWYSQDSLNDFYKALPGSSSTSSPKLPPIKVLFPTKCYVGKSPGGFQEGGTIFCNLNGWKGSKFRNVAYQSRCKRPDILMHTKSIVGWLEASGESAGKPAKGFFYMGSHNFTPSAWGKMKKATKQKPSAFVCPNTELGIVRVVEAPDAGSLQDSLTELSPVQRPVQPYGSGDEPWMMDQLLR